MSYAIRLWAAAMAVVGLAGAGWAQTTVDELEAVTPKQPQVGDAEVVHDLVELDAPWDYRPDRPAEVNKRLEREISIRLPRGARSLAFSAPSADLAGVLNISKGVKIGGGERTLTETWSIERYKLSTGQSLPPLELARRVSEQDARGRPNGRRLSAAERARAFLASCRLLSIGTDGDLAVVRTARDRLDVWSLSEGEHLCAFKPEGGAMWAAALADDSLLTLSSEGRLIRWQLPECRAVYERRLGPMRTIHNAVPVAISLQPGLSPNHRHLATWSGNSLLLLDVETGACLGVLAGQRRAGVLEPTFSPDGTQLAYTEDVGGTQQLIVHDLKKGRELSRILLPTDTWDRLGYAEGRAGGFTWADDRLGVVAGEVVVDLDEDKVLWRFQQEERNIVYDPPRFTRPGPGLWYYSSARGKTLNGVNLERKAGPAASGDLFAVEPGTAVEIVNRIEAPSPFAEQIESSLLESLARTGFRTAEAQAVQLVVETDVKDADRTTVVRYREQANQPPPGKKQGKKKKKKKQKEDEPRERVVDTQAIELQVSFVVDGRTAWTKTMPYLPQRVEVVESDDGKSPAAQLLELQWERVARYAPSLFEKLPRYVSDPDNPLPVRPLPIPQAGG